MKITPEIEAVARALIDHRLDINAGNALRWEELDEYERIEIFGYAIAAILALREPSDKMLINSHPAHSYEGLRSSYTAMIDAALGENK